MNLANVTNTVRNLWKDLVEKRLWPVAVVLVLALVAIPVVLAKPAPKGAAPPTPVVGASTAEPLVATPAAIRSNTGAALVAGKFKDPFKQQHVPKAPSTAGPTSSKSADTSAGSGGSKSAGGSGGSGGGSGGSNKSGGGDSPKPAKVTKLKVRFGLADGKRTEREITPGAPLPATTNPLIVFLDFGKDGTNPVFLVSSDVVKTEGDGACKPSKTICSEMTLHAGDTQFFDAQNGDQYQLDVLAVVKS